MRGKRKSSAVSRSRQGSGLSKPKGRPKRPVLRWDLATAAFEFEVSEAELTEKLTRHGVQPGDDGCYPPCQIADALYGGLAHEKERLTRATADKLERLNRVATGDLIPASWVATRWDTILNNVRTAVVTSRAPSAEKRRLLEALASIDMSDYEPPTE